MYRTHFHYSIQLQREQEMTRRIDSLTKQIKWMRMNLFELKIVLVSKLLYIYIYQLFRTHKDKPDISYKYHGCNESKK